jgi:hypothetical protein
MTTTLPWRGQVRPERVQAEPLSDRGLALLTGLSGEHGVLVRRLAQLQQRVGEQLQASARRVSLLEADNLRLRAELMRMKTAVAWNLREAAMVPPARPRLRVVNAGAAPGLEAAQAVICQTGCAGHAHPWLDPDGQCRRTGRSCEPTGGEVAPADTPGA